MESIIEQIRALTEALVEGSDLFLVELKIKPTNNVKVFLDGDNGITIEAIANINRALYKQIEESNLFPEGDFSLEVSSAGVDVPLKLLRQYHKNIGRNVAVTLQDESVIEGILKEATEDFIVLETTSKKKQEKQEYKISIFNIKKTIVQITFK
jgi:ribosome maturation factor RimP